MIEIVPVVTLGELITPIAICTVGFTQCLLIYMGMRRMDRASEERRQQIEQHRRQLDQQQQALDQQGEILRDVGRGIQELIRQGQQTP